LISLDDETHRARLASAGSTDLFAATRFLIASDPFPDRQRPVFWRRRRGRHAGTHRAIFDY